MISSHLTLNVHRSSNQVGRRNAFKVKSVTGSALEAPRRHLPNNRRKIFTEMPASPASMTPLTQITKRLAPTTSKHFDDVTIHGNSLKWRHLTTAPAKHLPTGKRRRNEPLVLLFPIITACHDSVLRGRNQRRAVKAAPGEDALHLTTINVH